MSVSTMHKLTVFAPSNQADALIRRLMKLRCVQVRQVEDVGLALSRVNCDAQRAEAERRVNATGEALEMLAKYSSRKGLLRSLVQTRSQLDERKFIDEKYDAVTEVVAQTHATVQRRNECRAELVAEQTRMHALAPWLTYTLPLELVNTQYAEIMLGALPAKTQISAVMDALQEYAATVESVFSDDDGEYVSVICHKEDSAGVTRALSELGFIKASLKEFGDLPRAAYDAANARCQALQTELEQLEQKMFELGGHIDDIEALWDVENSVLIMTQAKQKLAETDTCAVLEGWAPDAAITRITEALTASECAFEFEQPAPGEEPPILLKNNKFAANFEWVVGMYSYPKYGTYDPTMIMSIFYFLIFGLMFADVGYGAILALGGFLAPPLLKMRDGMRRTLNMFGYCGIACMVCGVIFGGWFGDMPYAIMVNLLKLYPTTEAAVAAVPFFNGLQLSLGGQPISLNPMSNPMAFLVVSLGIGAVHLIAGFVVKFVLLCKDKQVFAAIFDVGSWLIIFAGIGVVFLYKPVGIGMVVLGVLMIICTAGRSAKNPIMKFFKGLLGLYDAINYAADLLSYSRILALGLASAVIAQVVNMVGTMFVSGVPGFLVLLLVSIIGHTVNMALNVLGSFVHTSRLQYLEFFGKFFEDGGEAFVPVADSDRYTDQ